LNRRATSPNSVPFLISATKVSFFDESFTSTSQSPFANI
jgi:hypothetical protein